MNVYKEAMFSQGACNLGGLIHGWDRVMTEIQRLAYEGGHGTAWINAHPANVLFAEQVYHLAGNLDPEAYSRAHKECVEKEGL